MKKNDDEEPIRVHPKAALFPMLPADELQELADDIKVNGLNHPIILDAEGQLVDGRNRLAACKLAGVKPQFEQLNGRDPLALIISENVRRRNLNRGQQAMALAMVYPEPQRGRGHKDPARKETETGSFSFTRVKLARQVLHHRRDLAEAVLSGAVPLDSALTKMAQEQADLSSSGARMERLRAEAPDLADLVDAGKMKLSEAIAALDQRIADDRNNRRSATRAMNQLLLALEVGQSNPTDFAAAWMDRIDWSVEEPVLPLTRRRLEAAGEAARAIFARLLEESE